MDTLSGKVAYPAYTPGTQPWVNAVKMDFERGLISFDQMSTLFAGKVDPGTGALLPPTPGVLGGILSFIGSAGEIAISAWSKLERLDAEKARQEYQLKLAEYNLVHGMAGETGVAGYGGLNIYTLAAFAGLGLLAMLLLKKG